MVWRFNVVANCFEPAAALKGHSRGVVSLVIGANRLYSGSMDNTIKVSLLQLSAIKFPFRFFLRNVVVGFGLFVDLIHFFQLVVSFSGLEP